MPFSLTADQNCVCPSHFLSGEVIKWCPSATLQALRKRPVNRVKIADGNSTQTCSFYFLFYLHHRSPLGLPTLDIAWLSEGFHGTLPSNVGHESDSSHQPPRIALFNAVSSWSNPGLFRTQTKYLLSRLFYQVHIDLLRINFPYNEYVSSILTLHFWVGRGSTSGHNMTVFAKVRIIR